VSSLFPPKVNVGWTGVADQRKRLGTFSNQRGTFGRAGKGRRRALARAVKKKPEHTGGLPAKRPGQRRQQVGKKAKEAKTPGDSIGVTGKSGNRKRNGPSEARSENGPKTGVRTGLETGGRQGTEADR